MKYIKQWCLAVLASALLAGNASAANVLYWADHWMGTDYWTPAFTQRGDTVTTATSASDLVAQLGAGTWDVVVISENRYNTAATWATPIANYIAGGGRVVLNNWYTDATVDAATEAAANAPDNQTIATINAQGIATGLASGVTSNPFTLSDPDWIVFSQALTPTGSAESRCDFDIGSCAVFGNSGRTMRLGFIPDTLPSDVGVQVLVNAISALLVAPPPASYSVSGTVSGLDAGKDVVLRLNGANDLTVSANGGFTFAAALLNGASYAVTVGTHPDAQVCTVSNGSGTSSSNVTDVSVTCAASPLPVAPVAVPTLTEWGMLIMSGLMALAAFATLRRRRR